MGKSNKNGEESFSAGGAHAVIGFKVSDAIMMLVIVILCATCVLPFIHVAAKSISGNTAVMSQSVYFWPKDVTFDAFTRVFADGTNVFYGRYNSFLYSLLSASYPGYILGTDFTAYLFTI